MIEQPKVGDKVRIYANGEHFMKVGMLFRIEGTKGLVDLPDTIAHVDIAELQTVEKPS